VEYGRGDIGDPGALHGDASTNRSPLRDEDAIEGGLGLVSAGQGSAAEGLLARLEPVVRDDDHDVVRIGAEVEGAEEPVDMAIVRRDRVAMSADLVRRRASRGVVGRRVRLIVLPEMMTDRIDAPEQYHFQIERAGALAQARQDPRHRAVLRPHIPDDAIRFIGGRRLGHALVDRLKIRATGPEHIVQLLSGGNQQKVVFGKWLAAQPRVLLLDEPTRGIDVGTKQELYQVMRKLATDGAAILFYSTDYDELIGCCDRVLVMYDGAIKRELVGPEITERALIASALNLATEAPDGPTEMHA